MSAWVCELLNSTTRQPFCAVAALSLVGTMRRADLQDLAVGPEQHDATQRNAEFTPIRIGLVELGALE